MMQKQRDVLDATAATRHGPGPHDAFRNMMSKAQVTQEKITIKEVKRPTGQERTFATGLSEKRLRLEFYKGLSESATGNE